MSDFNFREFLKAFYGQAQTMSLATVDDAGLPHAANLVYFADECLNLLFLSHPDTAHARHIEAQPDVAATIYAPYDRFSQIRGVQIHGRCGQVEASAFEATWAAFLRRYPHAAAFEQRARTERFYCLTPAWVRLIDNTVAFGFKRETDWPPPES